MAESAHEFTIFYAWQSDTRPSQNRHLIEKALLKACERLQDDPAIPYRITVTSDTKGEPGLCDIPAAILSKIGRADAVITDLTYVAKSKRRRNPKFCPNPNVLFELGYAFNAIGPERLICVMNTVYGESSDIFFDVGHRRRPVTYNTAVPGKSRSAVIDELAEALTKALRPTVMLGPQSYRFDSDKEFESEANAIRRKWETRPGGKNGPKVFFTFHPATYAARRWPNGETLESLLTTHRVPDLESTHFYPPCERYTRRTYWGIYNVAYGQPDWSLSYAGQFWVATNIAADYDHPPSRGGRTIHSSSQPEQIDPTITGDKWINFPYARLWIANAFRFCAKFANVLHPNEEVKWKAVAEDIEGTVLSSTDGSLWAVSEPCDSPIAIREGNSTAKEYSLNWDKPCADFLEELFGMFEVQGGYIPRNNLEAMLQRDKIRQARGG